MSARAVIEKLGGIRPVARAMGLAHTTVQGWCETGIIPAYRQREVLNLAKTLNKRVTAADLIPGEAAA